MIIPMIFICAAWATPLPFMLPEDLLKPNNVSLEAQMPSGEIRLLPKDSDRPKLWYAPVAAIPIENGARIWYQRVNSAESDFADQRTLCVGDFQDQSWRLLEQNPAPPPWGGVNNICMRRSPFKPTWGGFNVFQIIKLQNLYQMLYWDQPDPAGQAGAMLAESPDGLVWEKLPGAVFTEHNDAFTVLPWRGEFLLFQTALEEWPEKPYPDNLDKKRRIITMRRSKDMRSWSLQEPLLRPDELDKPETEFYLMKPFPYGQGYAALLMNYFADPNLPGKHSANTYSEWIVSEDGLHWKRPFRTAKMKLWSYADPFVLNDKLHFVTWDDGEMKMMLFPSYGLFAVCAGDTPGSFVTPPLQGFNGKINLYADTAQGWIEAILADDNGQPLENSAPKRFENADRSPIPMDFPVQTPPAEHYRLLFRMHNAKIFALSCSQ